MGRTVGGIPVIEAEPDFICFLCGKIGETRPYGPNGEELCFDCAMRPENRRNSDIQMKIKLFGLDRATAEREADEEAASL